jgi:hypothetical protein
MTPGVRRQLVAKVATRDGRRLVGAVVAMCEHSLTVALPDREQPEVLRVADVLRAVLVVEDVSS